MVCVELVHQICRQCRQLALSIAPESPRQGAKEREQVGS